MFDRSMAFAKATFVSILAVGVISILDRSELFQAIAQVVTIPFLLFSLINFWISIRQSSHQKMQNEIKRVQEKSFPVVMASFAHDSLVEERPNNTYYREQRAKNTLEILKSNKEYKILTKISGESKVPEILYVVSLSMLLLSMILSEWIIGICPTIAEIQPASLTFIALLVALGEVLLKECLANRRFEKILTLARQQYVDDTDDKRIAYIEGLLQPKSEEESQNGQP